MSNKTIVELQRRIKKADDDGNTGKAALLRKQLKEEKFARKKHAEHMKTVKTKRKPGSAASEQSGSGQSTVDTLRNRGRNAEEDAKKQGG